MIKSQKLGTDKRYSGGGGGCIRCCYRQYHCPAIGVQPAKILLELWKFSLKKEGFHGLWGFNIVKKKWCFNNTLIDNTVYTALSIFLLLEILSRLEYESSAPMISWTWGQASILRSAHGVHQVPPFCSHGNMNHYSTVLDTQGRHIHVFIFILEFRLWSYLVEPINFGNNFMAISSFPILNGEGCECWFDETPTGDQTRRRGSFLLCHKFQQRQGW